jgi:hypothetical protein
MCSSGYLEYLFSPLEFPPKWFSNSTTKIMNSFFENCLAALSPAIPLKNMNLRLVLESFGTQSVQDMIGARQTNKNLNCLFDKPVKTALIN